jgi:hypothetical protein
MPSDRDNKEEREARIQQLLEEERLKADRLKQLKHHAEKAKRQAKASIRKPHTSDKKKSGA